MSLNDWLADGTVKRQQVRATEVARLHEVAERDLADAGIVGLSLDRRFATAYSAALQLATVVVRASGYRVASSSSGHHWRTLSLLAELMGDSQRERTEYLDSCRRARNQADYDRVGVVSDEEVDELVTEVSAFRADVEVWLATNHPDLL